MSSPGVSNVPPPNAPNPYPPPRRHRSFAGPIILIAIGVLLLMWQFYPGFDPWPWLFRYWPVILILIGLGKIWDSYYAHQHPDRAVGPWMTGTGFAWIILTLFFIVAFWHGRHWHSWGDHEPWGEDHSTQTIDLQGAKAVSFDLQFPAGRLEVSGGSPKLLDADFRYDRGEGRPTITYVVSGDHGQLNLGQADHHVHFGNDNNDWTLKLGNGAPLDMNVNIGAGETDFRFDDLDVEHLRINMGAGRLDLDLTKMQKKNVDADIEGGVGSATVRFPRDVGVHVVASGGIGDIDADGLHRAGDAYENDSYGKTATSINMTVHGGVGQIHLISE
jgi:hypothetical protein